MSSVLELEISVEAISGLLVTFVGCVPYSVVRFVVRLVR